MADAGTSAHFKGTLGFDTLGNVNLAADAWAFTPINKGALAGKAPNGKALVHLTIPVGGAAGGVLVQACVGPNARSALGGLDCSNVAPLTFYSLITAKGFLELSAPFQGNNYHLYIGTKNQPIRVRMLAYPEGSGYIMIDPNSTRVGLGLDWGFHKGDSGSIGWWKFKCGWYWNLDAQMNLSADLGVTYQPLALDASVDFNASASASAGGCGIGLSVGAGAHLNGTLHIASNSKYFDGTASAYVRLPVIPNISFNVHTRQNF